MPSELSFARVMAGACAVFASIAWWHHGEFEIHASVLLATGAGFLITGYTKPTLLRPLNKAWAQLGHVLFKVTNPIIMVALYVITMVPMGLLMRLFKKDPLHRTLDADAHSYWVVREFPGPAPETITRQF